MTAEPKPQPASIFGPRGDPAANTTEPKPQHTSIFGPRDPAPNTTLSPPQTPSTTSPTRSTHSENHTRHSGLIRDFIIGFSDGLTVPFALTAGLSSLGSSRLVILGGLAELFSGAISMGLGAFQAAITERKHYEVEEARERREVRETPAEEEEEVYEIFEQYGVERVEAKGVVEGLKGSEDMWVQVCSVSPVSSFVSASTSTSTSTSTSNSRPFLAHLPLPSFPNFTHPSR